MKEGIDWLNSLSLLNGKNIICLVDGEHHPPVTEWALKSIESKGGNITGLVFAGGTEKINPDSNKPIFSKAYPCYPLNGTENQQSLTSIISQAVKELSPELVIDLSDMPVIDSRKRFNIASILIAHGITYAGADFVFTPPASANNLEKPSLAIMGSGKRVGKTAASITITRILKRQGITPAVVAMGRGGPSEPQVVHPEKIKITPEYLLDIAAKGNHAASDYWENAILSGITTIGCRRCGGGLAGNPFISNVNKGIDIANKLPAHLILMEGSGPTLPPVKTDGKILVVGAHQDIEGLTDFFGEYRLLTSDLIIVTMCEAPMTTPKKIEAIKTKIQQTNPGADIALTVFRPEPFGDIKDKKVFLATTSPEEVVKTQISFLEKEYSCTVTGFTNNLSNRELLKNDLQKIDSAEVLLTEIKAASIDMAAKTAKDQGLEIVFLHNQLVLKEGHNKKIEDYIVKVCKKLALN